jgi:hypothetical protein
MSQYLEMNAAAGPYVELCTVRVRDSIHSAGGNALNGVDNKFIGEEEKEDFQNVSKEG